MEVLPVKFASALYVAVIECDGGLTAREVVVNVATSEPFSVPVPSVVAPSLNVTFPVGVPAPGATAATVAVKVTDCPNTDGLAEEVTVVVVLAWFTVCDTVLDVLVPKLVSPPYTAVIECEATESAAVANVATPDPFSVPVPRVVAPSLNVAVPVGVPPVPVTVAVNVTDCPKTEGFCEDVSVVVLGLTTASVGLAGSPDTPVVKVPPVQLLPLFGALACIVNDVVAAGVAALVVRVNVEVPVPPVSVTGFVLNSCVTPAGSADVILSVALQVPLPFESKVIKYVAEPP